MSVDEIRLTPQRRAVLDVLARSSDHPTAIQVLDRVREQVPGVGPATIYRTLALLVESGQAGELRVGLGQALRYERAVHRHDHLICTECGEIQDAHVALDSAAVDALATKTSFAVSWYDTQLYGRCARCAAKDHQ